MLNDIVNNGGVWEFLQQYNKKEIIICYKKIFTNHKPNKYGLK